MRRLRTPALLIAGALALTGCSFRGAASFPLPGGVGGGYDVKIEFTDVLDLVPQSAVKVNDVTVGSVHNDTRYVCFFALLSKADMAKWDPLMKTLMTGIKFN